MLISRLRSQVLGGVLLISATEIGVGMLAMPVATAPGGFFPALALYLICWAFKLCTGLLFLEVCTWMPKEANMITMCSRMFGPLGKIIAWTLYLLFLFLVMIAHIAAGGSLFQEILSGITPNWFAPLLYVVLFMPFIFSGVSTVDFANRILVIGIAVTYLLFVFTSIPYIDLSKLLHQNWSKAWFSLPILFAAFGYLTILPTVINYLDRNIKKIRLAIFIGTAIPLVLYIVWEFLILAIIPLEGPNSLSEAAKLGYPAARPLKEITHHGYVYLIAKSFSFFAMTASYLAFGLAYKDFLIDGLKWKKTDLNRIFVCLLIFLPPLIVVLINPSIFLIALGYGGGVASAILFGIGPPLMVWTGRHFHRYPDITRQLFGGRYLLTVLILFVIFEVVIEVISQFIAR